MKPKESCSLGYTPSHTRKERKRLGAMKVSQKHKAGSSNPQTQDKDLGSPGH